MAKSFSLRKTLGGRRGELEDMEGLSLLRHALYFMLMVCLSDVFLGVKLGTYIIIW